MREFSFAAFMQEWLYGNGDNVFQTEGYYRTLRVGSRGDFYTNVSTGKFFGYCLGYYLHTLILQKKIKGKIAIVEIGSERGHLITDVAEFFALYGVSLPIHFVTLEPFLNLQKIQQETFHQRNLQIALQCVQDIEALKELENDCLLFISNELLDAFVCELIFQETMAYVRIGNDLNVEMFFDSAPREILEVAESFKIKKGEIPIGILTFVQKIANSAKQWLFLGFDYGTMDARNEFSLRFYKQHTTTNLFINPTSTQYNKQLLQNFGRADMTYDVNFSLWSKAFLSAGGKQIFMNRQNRALVDMGLDKVCSWYMETFGLEDYMQQSAKIRTLISPGAFGERFFGFAFANF